MIITYTTRAIAGKIATYYEFRDMSVNMSNRLYV